MKYLIYFLICCQQWVSAQEISLLRTFYSDDYRDWIFYDKKENELGTLRTRWLISQDYSQWDIRIGEISGSIVLRWSDRPNEWEIRIQNKFYTAEPTWQGQIDSWRIQHLGKTYYLNLIDDPEGFQWSLEQDQNTLGHIYNVFYNDPREWAVEQEMEIDQGLLITAFFLVSYYSTPK